MTTPSQHAAGAAEELHKYFEYVRSDILRIPDGDKTEEIIMRHFAPLIAERDSLRSLLGEAAGALDSAIKTVEFEEHSFRPWHYDAKSVLARIRAALPPKDSRK